MDEKKKQLKPKTIFSYTQVGKEIKFSLVNVSKSGEITKINGGGDKALAELKKFVSAL